MKLNLYDSKKNQKNTNKWKKKSMKKVFLYCMEKELKLNKGTDDDSGKTKDEKIIKEIKNGIACW